jgi:hypothetical protein
MVIYVAVDGEEGGVVRAAGDLFDEGGEGKGFGRAKVLLLVLLADACLTVLFHPHKQQLVYIHDP